MPPKVASLAADERLGTLRSVHDPRERNPRSRSWLVLLGLPGVVLLPFTVGFLLDGLGWSSGLGLVLTGGYLSAAGRILYRDVLPGYGRVLYVYEHGLVLVVRREVVAVPWDAVAELHVSGVRDARSDATSWHCRLTREDRREFVIGSEFPAVREVVRLLSAEVTGRLLPKYIARVESGGTVRLGPFEITHEGVMKDAETAPWRDIAGVEIANGVVRVSRSGRHSGMTTTAGQVPNTIAFAALVNRLRQSRPPGPHASP